MVYATPSTFTVSPAAKAAVALNWQESTPVAPFKPVRAWNRPGADRLWVRVWTPSEAKALAIRDSRLLKLAALRESPSALTNPSSRVTS